MIIRKTSPTDDIYDIVLFTATTWIKAEIVYSEQNEIETTLCYCSRLIIYKYHTNIYSLIWKKEHKSLTLNIITLKQLQPVSQKYF